MNTATEPKNEENVSAPIFQNVEHPFTELFKLMPQLYTKNPEVLKAIIQHAENILESALRYSQSLGAVLSIAIQDEIVGAKKDELADTAWLFSFVANLAKSCCYAKAEAQFELAKQENTNFVKK